MNYIELGGNQMLPNVNILFIKYMRKNVLIYFSISKIFYLKCSIKWDSICIQNLCNITHTD